MSNPNNCATYARVGDKISCDFRFPWPHTKTLSLDTPEAAAYANELLDEENCAWKLKRSNVEITGP